MSNNKLEIEMKTADQMVEEYLRFIKRGMSTYTFENGTVELTTPFLDRYNDYMQVYVVREGNEFKLTDDSYVVSNLKISGMEFGTEHRRQIRDAVLRGFGVQLHPQTDELFVMSSSKDFAARKHDLLQAMLSIDGMYVLSRVNARNVFKQDVERYFQENGIHVSKDITLHSADGIAHSFDFMINPSAKKPERLIRAISKFDHSNMIDTLFSWGEIHPARPNTALYVITKDISVSSIDQNAVKGRGVILAPFDHLDRYRDELSVA